MSVSAVWDDILSHKECVCRQMPPQPPPVHLPNIRKHTQISLLVFCNLRIEFLFKKKPLLFKFLSLSILALKDKTGRRYENIASKGYIWGRSLLK